MYGLGDVLYEDGKEIKKLREENKKLKEVVGSVLDDEISSKTNIFSKKTQDLLISIVKYYCEIPKEEE